MYIIINIISNTYLDQNIKYIINYLYLVTNIHNNHKIIH